MFAPVAEASQRAGVGSRGRTDGPTARRASPAAPTRRPSEVPLRAAEAVTRAPAERLAPNVRTPMESFLHRDLGHVRVHTDAQASRSADALDARAYTLGRDIVFGAGEYRPDTAAGRALLAHELAHVAQAPSAPERARGIADVQGDSERAAERAAAAYARGEPSPAVSTAEPGLVHRQPLGRCPGGCHAPSGTQWVTFESLGPRTLSTGDFPDARAREFGVYLAAGMTWTTYKGCVLTNVQSIHNHDYNGAHYLVGYLLRFSNPKGSNFPSPTVILDLYGDVADERWHDPQALISVMSPIDFLGPALLEDLVLSAGRGLAAGTLRAGAALRGSARQFLVAGRLSGSSALGATMRAAATEVPALTLRTEAEALSELSVTGPSFADVSSELGLEAPGTVTYGSTSEAAGAAREFGLESGTRPGFQTHATASAVRTEFGVTGRAFQSAHVAPQAVYRSLRAAGVRIAGVEASEGRALTTLLSREAHAAMDRGWIAEWNAAVRAGRQVTAGDVYSMVSRSVLAVPDSLINDATKGALIDRLGTELFSDLGLSPEFVIVPPRAP